LGFIVALALAWAYKNAINKGFGALVVLFKREKDYFDAFTDIINISRLEIDVNLTTLNDITEYRNRFEAISQDLKENHSIDDEKIAEIQSMIDHIGSEIKTTILKLNDDINGYNYWIRIIPYRFIFHIFRQRKIDNI
jgi:hypothetical protein